VNIGVDRWQETHRAPGVVDGVVDTGQEVADKVSDVAEEVGDAAEREARKAGKWLTDRWPG